MPGSAWAYSHLMGDTVNSVHTCTLHIILILWYKDIYGGMDPPSLQFLLNHEAFLGNLGFFLGSSVNLMVW